MSTVVRRPTPGSLLWRVAMKWRAAVDRAVAPFGLTHAQYSVLASLRGMVRGGERPSQRRLADHIGLEPIYVSKLVRTLEEAGFVKRADHPDDTRAVQLTLTARGTVVVDHAIEVVAALQERLTEPLGGTASARTRTLIHMLEELLSTQSPDAARAGPSAIRSRRVGADKERV
jgi:DNA-binding MarR family transcriptional regulator